MGYTIQQDVEFPGRGISSSGIGAKLDNMNIGETAMIEFEGEDSKADIHRFRAGLTHYAKANGWKFKTTARGSNLYIQKIAITSE